MLFAYGNTVHAQNGKIVEMSPYSFAESSVAAIQQVIPDTKLILAVVNFYSIKYLSDGLKVRGYLSVPKKRENIPALFIIAVVTANWVH